MTDPIRIGHIALSFHEASAREVARILESHGHEVSFAAAPHEEAFAMLGRGEVDILASAWLWRVEGGAARGLRSAIGLAVPRL